MIDVLGLGLNVFIAFTVIFQQVVDDESVSNYYFLLLLCLNRYFIEKLANV